ncbi:hypothetical protein DPMN_039011 [Dreissena polymorpha]|uniref:Apple domain-containing protein n=1 Tax=Dreissena polymorpha TaxID=45954 RepID=A0A9D4ME93_DREPO|nr:hypothetical protein DPMN_039011 [Dreissena polymorpha]
MSNPPVRTYYHVFQSSGPLLVSLCPILLSVHTTMCFSLPDRYWYRYVQSSCPYILQCVSVYRTVTGIAMSNPPVRTYFNVKTVIMCTSICLRQTEPACLAAQFYQATESCTLFNGFEHTIDPSNSYTTVVFDFAAHFF